MTHTRRQALATISSVGALGLAGCFESGGADGGDGGDGGGGGGGSNSPTDDDSGASPTPKDTVKAAYVYAEPLSDSGFYHRHEVGRQAVTEKFDWLETTKVEDVAASEAVDVFNDLVNQGYDIIEGTTFDYGPACVKVGKQNPDVYLESVRVSRVEDSPKNVGQYVGNIAEARYLSGVAAGMMTETNTLGFVVAFPIPVLYGEINAMMLGAKSVNPDVTMEVRTINTWFDPTKEQQAAEALINEGADVLADHQSSPAVTRTAANNDVMSVGYADTLADVGGDGYITSCVWNWEPFYEASAKAAKEGRLMDKNRFEFPEQRLNFFGLEKEGILLDEWGPNVPKNVQDEVSSTEEAIINGETEIWAGTKWESMNKYERNTTMGEYIDGVQS